MPPVVSVLIPTAGRRPDYLTKAIESVGRSRGAPDFEILVVQDRLGSRPPRPIMPNLAFYPKPQEGLSAAVNYGAHLARGRYLTVLDDDDMIARSKLAVMSTYLDMHPEADVVYGLPEYVSKAGEGLKTPAALGKFRDRYPVLTWAVLAGGVVLCVHGKATMYRREVWDRTGRWDERIMGCEEFEWHQRMLLYGAVFHGIDHVTDLYRIHPKQKSRSNPRHRERQYVHDKITRLAGYQRATSDHPPPAGLPS